MKGSLGATARSHLVLCLRNESLLAGRIRHCRPRPKNRRSHPRGSEWFVRGLSHRSDPLSMPRAVACACGWYHRRPEEAGRACTGAIASGGLPRARSCDRTRTPHASTSVRCTSRRPGSPTAPRPDHRQPPLPARGALASSASPESQSSAVALRRQSVHSGAPSHPRPATPLGGDRQCRRDWDRPGTPGRATLRGVRPARCRRPQLTHAIRMGRPGYRWSQFKKQARQRHVEVCIAQHDHADLVVRSCVYCGTRPSPARRIGVDRIDSARPYELDNCVPSCAPCNYMKTACNYMKTAKPIARRHPAPSEARPREASEASEVSLADAPVSPAWKPGASPDRTAHVGAQPMWASRRKGG
mmetsp:Transcript_25019/g.51763  ORF Transcript_25019/g.51763 Transcript_25019/m.51763 type:complete len:357 (-) Transcript_25019:275-1345(-)